jgi:hypothetical protein
MARIATRDRAYEREMDRAYIESLQRAYERCFSTAQIPLLTIDTDNLDYVRDASALVFVEGQVRTALGIGAYQQTLPRMGSVGLLRTPATLTGMTHVTSGRDAVGEFLAASEAMGRVSATLADGAAGWSGGREAQLRAALQDAMVRLQRLAQAAGVDLQEVQW